ncbi:MAG: NADH-quinone oxidoreductase subunit L [Phycisphaerae bacterium]|nr:NADH-quinone oxidoreductase subunit L [Phycisphaerae bacterium]
MDYQTALAIGVLIPLVSFAILAVFGYRLGKPRAGYVAFVAIGLSCALSIYVLVGWWGSTPAERAELTASAYRFDWGAMGDIPVTIGVKLDSLTVIMYFMVTFVSSCIFFFSLGYMEGHSDEIDGISKYHRFFCYFSLFAFSMLGLVVASSLLFLFIFWELVGLCSYLLIGFYFDKKFASDAGIKAFVTNRVGDFGFIVGLAMVVLFLGTFDLDEAATRFAGQFRTGTGIFDSSINLFGWQVSGMALATLMGIGLFCGAMGKSAQFPLHVWLPDAMAGPTPVSALIHAATMVAAGVYLVARVFRLLTPDAQMFVAVIGCITLTITALIAIVQTDIKKVLAYSTLSQLGYMIFGMGCGAWIAALFHLMTHAFFKAMLFLCSGQVIEGCHHEQDIRNMGGLRRKMPYTCWTFFVGVLAIAGFGIPASHFGLGGFFSKDEILAVAYERTYNLPALHETDAAVHERPVASGRSANRNHAAGEHSQAGEHGDTHEAAIAHAAGAHGGGEHHATGTPAKLGIAATLPALPKWMFWLPIIIAYVTPFYMMRCWWLTFCGKPRDEHVHEHAHENWKMFVPLVVLSVGTVFCSYFVFRHLIDDAAGPATSCPTIVAFDGTAHNPDEAGGGAMLTLTHAEGQDPHAALAWMVGLAWFIGGAIAWFIYRDGLGVAERIKKIFPLSWAYRALEQKLYFDHVYDNVLVGGTILLGYIARLFDNIVVDGLVNLSAFFVRVIGIFTGRQLDMSVERGDVGFVDAIANGIARVSLGIGTVIRRPQSGRIRAYVLVAAGSVAVVLLVVLLANGGS